MTRILFIRHGESEANEQGLFAGHLNVYLTDRGREQARLTAEFVAQNYSVDKVYASDLHRAFDTGKAVADRLGLPITACPTLREIHAGEWDGVRFDDLADLYPADFHVWYTDRPNARCTGGESVAEAADRICAALTEIARENDGKTVVVASHATPISSFLALIHPKGLSSMPEIGWVPNASVTELTYENGKFAPVRIGMADHLADLKTELPANI